MNLDVVNSGIDIGDYFSPKQYTENDLTVENAWKVNRIVSNLSEATFVSAYFATGTTSFSFGFFAVAMQPVAIGLLITSIAIGAIGMYLSSLSEAHLLSFSEKKRAQFALERLKDHLTAWPSFENHEAFQVHLRNNPGFGYSDIMSKVKDINTIYPLVDIFYNPSQHPYPQIRLNTSALDEDEIKEILLASFSEGVIIHLTRLEIHRPGGSNSPVEAYFNECKEANPESEILRVFNESQNLSIYLYQEIKKKCALSRVEFPLDYIIRQIDVLSPKLYIGMHGHAFNPPVLITGAEISKIPLSKYFSENTIQTILNTSMTLKNPMSAFERFNNWLKG